MKKLLLVDDDPDVLEALTVVLSEYFDVAGATDGAEALRRMTAERFDVVLLDLMMPVMDGETAVAELRRRAIATPILLGSAAQNLFDVATQLNLPSIPKPYEVWRLISMLHELAGDPR